MKKEAGKNGTGMSYAYIHHRLNNLVRIQFTNGSVTKCSYSTTGQKLGVEYYVATPSTSGAFNVEPVALTQGRTMYADSTYYHLGGSLVRKDGMLDRYLFDGGYAKESLVSSTNYRFNFLNYKRDHLGNVRVVMAQDGTVEQKTHYYPFGGIMYGSTGQGVQPYKYGGKELDRTNGLDSYDFGARSYFADRLQWMTMDPLCEKYYDTSPYAYCKNDPVNMIDLDGRDEWQFNSQGILVKHIKTEEYDSFFIVDDDGKKIDEKNLILGYGTVVSFSQRETKDNEKYDIFELTGSPQTKDLFTFLADNTSVEWNLATGGWIASGTYNDYITTSHSKGNEIGIVSLIENQLSKGYYLLHLYHNHTNGSAFPSGLGYNVYDGFEMGDKQHAGWVSSIFGDDVRFSIYVPNKKQFVSYGPNSTIADFPEFWDFHSKK